MEPRNSVFITSKTLIFVAVFFQFLVMVCVTSSKSDEESTIDTFTPTREWQVVKKGQPIPKGLHVRINFETGVTEAKLLDPEESDSKAVSTVSEIDFKEIKDSEANNKGKLTHDEITASLKNMKDDYVEKEEDKKPSSPFRNYEELKNDFDKLHIKVQTDMELIKELMGRFPTSGDEERVFILTDLEYLVHQIDNAQEFARLEGFTGIVYPCFNSTNIEVRSEAIKLLGSAVQSNPQVQISALASGSIQLLLRTILGDKNATVRSRAMYALSCLIRSFPAAQLKMVTEGGLAVLAQAFDKENSKLQVKVVTLLNDLVEERQATREMSKDQASEETSLKLDQYKSANLELKLLEAGWCNRVPELLLSETSSPDNDVVEKVLNAMQTLFHICGDHFRNSRVETGLHVLENWYRELANSEEDDYYKSLAELVVNFRNKLVAGDKDEL